MPMHKLTGMISHRHPFYGYGNWQIDQALAAIEEGTPTQAVPATPATTEPFSFSRTAKPFIGGLITGLVTYSIAKSLQIEKKKAVRMGFLVGVMDIGATILGTWIGSEIGALKQFEPAAQTTITPAVTPTIAAPVTTALKGWY